MLCHVFFFKQKTAYEMRISDWSSDVCSSDLQRPTISRQAMPATAMITPAPVISNMPKGASPRSCATPSTRMFVEVPISVVVPPKMLAKESGISSLDGAMRSEEHTSELQSLMRISYAVFCLKKKTNKST